VGPTSAIGTKRTWCDVRSESAFGGKAETEFGGRQQRLRKISEFGAFSFKLPKPNFLSNGRILENLSINDQCRGYFEILPDHRHELTRYLFQYLHAKFALKGWRGAAMRQRI
jgi:hypothetical protein